jgi:putative phage-type endonuclease
MRVIESIQGTSEWKAARAGHVTASRISDVMAKIKSGEAACRRDYKAQIVAEILTGAPSEDGYTNAAMQWGNEQEPFARAAYEIQTGQMVDQVGFVLHPTIERAGASPDGLVGDDGLVEIKCPKTSTHLQYVCIGKVPADYQPQMLWQMACTGREWVDFASYDPRLPERHQLFIRRLGRDNTRIAEFEAEVRNFQKEVNGLLLQLGELELKDLQACSSTVTEQEGGRGCLRSTSTRL